MAAVDVQLSRDFWLHEAPCWVLATPDQVAALQETAQRVLQPVRNVFGKTIISSWIWWAAGCQRRTGSHAWGGTVDLIVPGVDLRRVWEWGKTHLLPTGYIGRWIYEPETYDKDGNRIQGEHIHSATRQDMIRTNGDGRILALEEQILPSGESRYYVALEYFESLNGEEGGGITGTYLRPFEVEGITVVATRRAGWSWALGLGILLAAVRARTI